MRRDDGSKTPTPIDGLAATLTELLDAIQQGLLNGATAARDERIHAAETIDDFEARLDGPGGFIDASWDGTDETELKIKERTKATVRVLLETEPGPCVMTGQAGTKRGLFARAY